MMDFPAEFNWIQWCTWVSGPALVPTEEFVYMLAESSGGKLIPEPREGIATGTGPRWGLADKEEQLLVLVGDERIEIREIFLGEISNTKLEPFFLQAVVKKTKPIAIALNKFLSSLGNINIEAIAIVCGVWSDRINLSSIITDSLLLEGIERAEIGTCQTFHQNSSCLKWNRWLRIRKGISTEEVGGLWLEVDVNTRTHVLPSLENHNWAMYLTDGLSLMYQGIEQLESLSDKLS